MELLAFGLDGASYRIDLDQPSRAGLAEALAPFIEAVRKVFGGGRGGLAGVSVCRLVNRLIPAREP
jgi:hypothetical protein